MYTKEKKSLIQNKLKKLKLPSHGNEQRDKKNIVFFPDACLLLRSSSLIFRVVRFSFSNSARWNRLRSVMHVRIEKNPLKIGLENLIKFRWKTLTRWSSHLKILILIGRHQHEHIFEAHTFVNLSTKFEPDMTSSF